MKTTIEINDALLKRAKQLALERNTTLRTVLEAALRQFLDEAQYRPQKAFKLRKCPIQGRGLQPGLDWHDWDTIRTLIYEGRGG
jgi:Bacterial antitoxin of type II TA system, VapB